LAVKVEYKASVAKDPRRLDRSTALHALGGIEKALVSEGRRGEPLVGEFAGMYRLRDGEYRVVYARTGEGYLVLRIGHR
jgi:mRNA-degrading endonuclease RelE of RelBE toxin-antitoxin system